jgi:exopolysaccharide production protein ExoZ
MYQSLQASRAFAALIVVLFHLGGMMASEKYFGRTGFAGPFSFGAAGVEFFFVLSGFIILTAHRGDLDQPGRLADYLRKRVTRIYPTFWLVFLGVYLLALSSRSLRSTVPHDPLILLKSLWLIPQDKLLIGGTGAPVLAVSWTLQYEVFFYACFASVILNRWLALVVAVSLAAIYLAYSGTAAPFPLSFLAQDYIPLFAMGMLVACVGGSDRLRFKHPGLYAGLGFALFGWVALDHVMNWNLLVRQATLLYGLASSLIILGLVKLEDAGRILGGHRGLQLLGNASYALYLIHYPLISLLGKVALAARLNRLGLAGAFIAYFGILGVCLASSVVFHLWIERPVTRWIRALTETAPKTGIARSGPRSS